VPTDLYDVAWQLSDMLEHNRSVFLKTEPEVPDHTIQQTFKCIICTQNQRLEIEVGPKEIMSLVAQFDYTIFDKDKVDRLYTWNFKSFATYFHSCCSGRFIIPQTSVIDLKVIENFLGIHKNVPENYIEVVNRTKQTVKYKWQSIYKAVLQPLMFKVLPTIETTPLLNEIKKRAEYPYYEIEGQIYGRMNSSLRFNKCYSPHRLGPDSRAALKPRGINTRFLCADFKHCEVTVLQWLSKDPELKKLLESGEDLHSEIYRVITGDQCDTPLKRKQSKLMFLPTIYGISDARLAEMLELPVAVAAELIRRMKIKFSVAFEWIEGRQNAAKDGEIVDYFGRPRRFEEGKAYLARNFVVQGVAATVCHEKLIELCEGVNSEKAYVAYSVHDGYGLVCEIAAAREAYVKTKTILESESKLCPGLKMKVKIEFGAKLDNMKVLWKD
jgi:hypothetical protein